MLPEEEKLAPLIKFLEEYIKDRKKQEKVFHSTFYTHGYFRGQGHAAQDCLERLQKILRDWNKPKEEKKVYSKEPRKQKTSKCSTESKES